MKTAIISDVHSNLHALESVLKDIESQGVDAIYNLGDSVGYCAFPQECLELIRSKAIYNIMGNHDGCVCDDKYRYKFPMNYMANVGISYGREKLDSDQISYLGRLPFQVLLKESGIALSHGSFANPEEWNYIFGKEDAVNDYYALNATFPEWKISFIGHTHYPVVFCNEDNKAKAISSGFNKSSYPIRLKTTRKYIINVGSVGQPRDSCPLSCYVILETKGKYHNLTFRRVEYNVEDACAAIDEEELPPSLSERLRNGK